MTAPPWNDDDEPLRPDERRLVAALSELEAALELPDLAPLASPEVQLDPALAGQFTELSDVLAGLVQLRSLSATPPGAEESPRFPNASDPRGVETRRLGRFEIVREIGRGGHGIVFLARDPELGRELALKVPRPELLVSPGARQRFLREGRAAATLDHPNLVAVYEAGQAGPICYLAQEFSPGENLESWLARQPSPLGPRLVAELVAALADGVEHAHRRGVIHRDLKPGNVLVESRPEASGKSSLAVPSPVSPAARLASDLASPTAAGWFPRIVDFGLARIDQEPGTLTATGALLGTPAYMAPEQLETSLGPVGPPADIYALGTILCQLLTGRPPFQGASQTELLKGVLLDRPTSPRSLRPGIPADLEAICLRALEKQPLDRYASAADLAADLRRYLCREPTLARPITPLGRLVRWARRSPALAGASGLAAAALVALFVSSLEFNRRLSRSLRTSEAERTRAEANERLAREHVYTTDLSAAQAAWLANDLSSAARLLEPYRPGGEWVGLHTIEADYLEQLVFGGSQVVARREGRLGALAVAPDGHWLAAGGQDGSLAVWELTPELGEPRWRQSLGDGNELNAVAFSPDGSLLAVAADQGPLRLFVAPSGRPVATLEGHAGWVADVCFSPDGRSLASAGSDRTARVWDLTSRTCRATLADHGDIVRGVRFVNESTQLVTTCEDQQIRLWDAADGRLVSGHPLLPTEGRENARPTDLNLAPDGRTLVVTLESSHVTIWEATPKGLEPRDELRSGLLRAATLLPDGQTLWAGTSRGELLVWPRNDSKPREVLRGHRAQVLDIVAAPTGLPLFTGSTDGELRKWQGDDGLGYRTLLTGAWNPRSLALSPTGDRLAVASDEGRVLVVSTRPVAIERELVAPSRGRVDDVEFSPDGRQLLARTEDPPGAIVWDAATSEIVHDLSDLVEPRGGIHLLPDGRSVWTTNERQVRRVELASGRVTANTELDESVRNSTISPDGTTIAVGGQDGGLWLLDSVTLRTLARLPSHAGSIHWLRFSPSGTWLATTGDDLAVRTWDWRRRHLKRTLSGAQVAVTLPHFSADERTLLGLVPDLEVVFWNLETGRLTLRVELAHGHLCGCAPDPAGEGIYLLHRTKELETALRWLPLKQPHPGGHRPAP